MKLSQVPLGKKENISVLFCDMFNYTAICEEYSLEFVAELLDNYYKAMATAILGADGVLGSFVGDAIIGYFGLTDQNNDASNAINAALSIIQKSDEFNLPNGQPVLNGIGIDRGELIIAQVGPVHEVVDHIVIGRSINTASRLEKLTRYSCHRMLISDTVYEHAKTEQQEKFVEIGNRYIRGIEDSMIIYGEQLEY